MSKRIYIFVSVIVLLLCISCGNNQGYVLKEFSWLISEKKFLKQPSAGDPDWYWAYDLNTEQIADMLNNDFRDHGYQGWEHYNGNLYIGDKETIQIKGDTNDVVINLKEGSDPPYNQIAMFIDLTEKN